MNILVEELEAIVAPGARGIWITVTRPDGTCYEVYYADGIKGAYNIDA